MKKQYISDDRNILEDVEKIRNMTDEEWEEYVKVQEKMKESGKNE